LQWNPDEISKRAQEDFESAWMDSATLLTEPSEPFKRPDRRGRVHPVEALREKIRRTLLRMGFDEVITPMIWEDDHVKRQFGPESVIILDRCYYLAGLPRPEIGLSKTKVAEIRKIVPGFDKTEKLRRILRDYKVGRIESDDFVEEMVRELDLPEEKATQIIDTVFSELKRLRPVPTNLTVLSHFTTAWFPILRQVLEKKICPVMLFTTGLRMRREQREDATHLRSHYNASIVIMDENISLREGRRYATRILSSLGFSKVQFQTKRATSRYYAPGTEEEVFVEQQPSGQLVEVADLGMYSPVALSRYGIPYPVFNMGLSIGRLAMISTGVQDIRELTYPEIYVPPFFADDEIYASLRPIASPKGRSAREISKRIVQVARERADENSPCRFSVWRGSIYGRGVQVEIVEEEEGVKLVGPAAFNVISARDGNIVSIAPGDPGYKTDGLSYIFLLAQYASSKIEEEAKSGLTGTRQIRVGMVRSAADIFLKIPLAVRRYIESRNKRIEIGGPVFTTVRYTIR